MFHLVPWYYGIILFIIPCYCKYRQWQCGFKLYFKIPSPLMLDTHQKPWFHGWLESIFWASTVIRGCLILGGCNYHVHQQSYELMHMIWCARVFALNIVWINSNNLNVTWFWNFLSSREWSLGPWLQGMKGWPWHVHPQYWYYWLMQ